MERSPVKKSPLPPGVHLILGHSAGGIFNRVFQNTREQMLVDVDVLSAGPTPATDNLDEWWRVRLDFWNGVVPDLETRSTPSSLIFPDLGRLNSADRATIWAATDLKEQLFIAHMIHRATQAGLAREQLRIVLFEKYPFRDEPVPSLGFLNEENMLAHPLPREFSADEFESYVGLWNTLTSSHPTFHLFGDEFPRASAHVKRSARLMLRRFPNLQTGLPYWDQKLLEQLREGPRNAARVVGNAIVSEIDDGDGSGDSWLFYRLLQLASSKHLLRPLVNVEGDTSWMARTTAELTPFGCDVMEGRISSYPTNPIDYWAAGVKLSSADGTLWFNDGGKLVPV